MGWRHMKENSENDTSVPCLKKSRAWKHGPPQLWLCWMSATASKAQKEPRYLLFCALSHQPISASETSSNWMWKWLKRRVGHQLCLLAEKEAPSLHSNDCQWITGLWAPFWFACLFAVWDLALGGKRMMTPFGKLYDQLVWLSNPSFKLISPTFRNSVLFVLSLQEIYRFDDLGSFWFSPFFHCNPMQDTHVAQSG